MTTPYRLRVATPADDASVSFLLKASYTTLMPPSYEAALMQMALPLITRANPILLASGTYYIVEDLSGTAVGCGGWTVERPGTGEIEPHLAHIRHFATDPDYLGKGIGRLIYAACVTEAKKTDTQRLMCFSSLNAVSFYGALGFQTVHQIEIPMGPSLLFPSVLMEATI